MVYKHVEKKNLASISNSPDEYERATVIARAAVVTMEVAAVAIPFHLCATTTLPTAIVHRDNR